MSEAVLNPVILEDLARSWLREDHSAFDISSMVVGDTEVTAILWCKSQGVLAGLPFVNSIFALLDCDVKWFRNEGEWLNPVTKVAEVSGTAKRVLLSERVILNVLARASGVASAARKMREILDEVRWDGVLAGTRKTTPGFRLVEKYALLVGGADTHRYDMSSMTMLKDNHIWTAGSIDKAVQIARNVGGFSRKIEVECRTLEEAQEACTAGCDIVMLDNFEPQNLLLTAQTLKVEYPNILLEASGGIIAGNVTDFAIPGIDIISSSSLVQGYDVVDFSLKIQAPSEDC